MTSHAVPQEDPEDCPEALMGRLYNTLADLPRASRLRWVPARARLPVRLHVVTGMEGLWGADMLLRCAAATQV